MRSTKVIFSIKSEFRTKISDHALNAIVEIRYQNLMHTNVCTCTHAHTCIHTYIYIHLNICHC